MWIELTGTVEEFEDGYRARVHIIGVHAYGATEDEAARHAVRLTDIKLGIWRDAGVLEEVVSELDIPHWHDEPEWIGSFGDALFVPPPTARLDLTLA